MPTVVPSLVHVICGVGFPVAVHRNTALSVSMTVWFDGFVVSLGASVKRGSYFSDSGNQFKPVANLISGYEPVNSEMNYKPFAGILF